MSTDDGKRHVTELGARLRELTEQRDELASALDDCLAWISDSEANKQWTSITTPDFVVKGVLALSRAVRNP